MVFPCLVWRYTFIESQFIFCSVASLSGGIHRHTSPFLDEMEKTLATMRVGNEDIHIKNLCESNNRLLLKRRNRLENNK
ncbi:hypothetical protein AB6A40_001484 [Gnathostoma spinigerum]|uniref:non-specific serine/threonine protein kinase n=1 Tax=Gnathostoma spinigerum TaxID=75299 RepID=A0ABD6EEL8_9BILA